MVVTLAHHRHGEGGCVWKLACHAEPKTRLRRMRRRGSLDVSAGLLGKKQVALSRVRPKAVKLRNRWVRRYLL